MSSDIAVAKRYARALFEVAQQQNQVDKVEEDLKAVVSAIKDTPDFQKLLAHPNIASAVKLDLLKQAFQGKVTDAVYNTLQLLITRRREAVLPALLNDYVAIANEARGQADATVYTPFPLSEEEASKVAVQFGKLTGKKIRVHNVIDSKLLGGLQVRIGDRLYDGSLAGKLDRLQKALKQTQAL